MPKGQGRRAQGRSPQPPKPGRKGGSPQPGQQARGQRQAGSRGRNAHAGRLAPAAHGRAPRSEGHEVGLLEGRRALAEALESGLPLRRVLVQAGSDGQDQTLARLVERASAAGVPIEFVPKPRLDALSSHGAHQGLVAQTRPFAYSDLSEVIAAAGPGDGLIVLLDHVTDEGNFGAIVRSAEVVGAAGVVIAKARAASVGVGAYKTSAGAVMHLPIAQVPNLAGAVDQIKRAGFWVAGATEHAEQSVWEAPLAGRLCLVMGSEGEGISRLLRERCDFECRLPQRGRVESLNVAQAATVMCYEWLRRQGQGEGSRA